jgi:adenylate cyclase
MERIWQWVWDRYGARWSWVIYAASATLPLPIYLSWSFLIVAIEESSDYVEAAAVTVVGVPVLAYVNTLPGLGRIRLVERWAAGHEVDRARALDATYAVTGGRLPEWWGPPAFGPACYRSLSVRSPGRLGRGWPSTGSWALW